MIGRNSVQPVGTFLGVLCVATAIDIGAGWLRSCAGFGDSMNFCDKCIWRWSQSHSLLAGLAVFVYGFLQKAQAVRPLNVGIVWIFMAVFYGIGYVIAAKHYR